MSVRYTEEQLKKLDPQMLISIIQNQQEQLDSVNQKLDWLMEQIRVANNKLYGHHSEKMPQDDVNQLSLFDMYPALNEAEATADPSVKEPDVEVVVASYRRKKKPGKRQEDLKDLPEEFINHPVSKEELDQFFGPGNYRRFQDEHYDRLRYQPARWIVERHSVEVYVGTDGLHQDEFLRGDHEPGLFRGSIATPSLVAAIINGKYTNALPLYRIEQEFKRNDINISRQTMANWMIGIAEHYLPPLYDALKERLLRYHVNQADETPVQVLHLSDEKGNSKPEVNTSTCYMWVHRSGEFYKEEPVVLYEFVHGRGHEYPLAFYKDFNGVLVTDSLEQYHTIEKKLKGVTSANCWDHLRRPFTDAISAMSKDDPGLRESVAWKALAKIAAIYHVEASLKDMTPEVRLKHRQEAVKPLVDAFFAWVKQILADGAVMPKSKTGNGLNFAVNQEQYLRVFLTDGEVPISDAASERAIRPFTVGRKNWILINTEKGTRASALLYSITETAKLNNLKPYYYFEYILEKLPGIVSKDGGADPEEIKKLLPWAVELPEECRIKRR